MRTSINDKWQSVQVFIAQNPILLQRDLRREFNKLRLIRLIISNILVFFFQYSGLMLTTLTTNAVPVWFATGTACAFVFMRGYRILPGIWLGSFFAYLLVHAGVVLALISACIYTLQSYFIPWFCYRYIGPEITFYNAKQFTKFIVLISVVTAFMSGLLLLSANALNLLRWAQWWLANLNSVWIFILAFLTLDAYFPQWSSLKKRDSYYPIFLYSILSLMTLVLMFFPMSSLTFLLSVGTSLILLLCGFLGWCSAVIALFITGILLAFGAFMEAPVFTGMLASVAVIYLAGLLSVNALLVCELASSKQVNNGQKMC